MSSYAKLNRKSKGKTLRLLVTFGLAFSIVLVFRGTNFANEGTSKQDGNKNQVVFFSIPIGADAAPVFASPDVKTYQTGTILKDRYVEVYFRNQDGFCAIRPPYGSFSWVNGKFIKEENGSFGRVVSPNGKVVPSRVGGDSPLTSSVVQVGLQPNQKIKIVDKLVLDDGSVWFKIAPPPGEFRWIEEGSLVFDPALKQLPPRLMFQSEYLVLLKNSLGTELNATASSEENAELELTLPPLDGNNVLVDDQTNETSIPMDVQSFKMEVARLNADVFQTLQKNVFTKEELELLALRAEGLFDAAPNDDERFGVQSIYEVIKKTEKTLKTNSQIVPPSYPTQQQGAFDLTNSQVQPYGSTEFPGTNPFGVQTTSNVSEGGLTWQDPQPYFGSPNPMNPTMPNGAAFPNAAGFQAYPDGAIVSSSSNVDRSKLAFAFSSANMPFRSRTNEARIVSTPNASKTNFSLAKLPPLFPMTKTIVPPQDYNLGVPLSANRNNSKLVAEAKRKDAERLKVERPNTSKAKVIQPAPSVPQMEPIELQARRQLNQNGLVFQEPAFAMNRPANRSSNEGEKLDDRTLEGNWRSVAGAVVPSPSHAESEKTEGTNVQPIFVAKGQDLNGKIRQTSGFTPVAVRPDLELEGSGVLTVEPNAPKGKPQYSLVSSSGETQTIAYLDTQNGVALEKYVGKNIGVKGTVGTVRIDGKLRKLIVVSSVFPL